MALSQAVFVGLKLWFEGNRYYQDLFEKPYNFVKFLTELAGLSLLAELYFTGDEIRDPRRRAFGTLSFAVYFVFGSVLFVAVVLNLRNCCRSKESHPLGNRISEETFQLQEMARKISLVVSVMYLASLLTFFQVFLASFGSGLETSEYSTLQKSMIIFAGIFAGVSIVIVSTGRFYK